MGDSVRVVIASDADVVTARQAAREMGAALGFSSTDLTLLATAISEVARNITSYAGTGEVAVRVVRARGREGIEVVASDEGPGIADVELALQDGFTTGNGLELRRPLRHATSPAARASPLRARYRARSRPPAGAHRAARARGRCPS